MRLARRLLAAAALLGAAASPAGAYVTFLGDCSSVSMTVTATYPNDPGFPNLWKYTLSGSWDVGQRALSHMDILLMLGDCDVVCLPGIVQFPTPAGQSTGADNGSECTVLYTGSYLCTGDPSIPPNLRQPTAKFEATAGQTCQPQTVGSGTWCFYSSLPPGDPATHPDVIVIKHGNTACTGDVTGQLPICRPPTAVSEASWGAVKGLFK